eukprot:5285616-Prymnesium_polylepis.1
MMIFGAAMPTPLDALRGLIASRLPPDRPQIAPRSSSDCSGLCGDADASRCAEGAAGQDAARALEEAADNLSHARAAG